MPSSTSSSDPHQPTAVGGPWLGIWVTGCATAVLVLAGMEYLWRHRGHEPGIVPGVELWCWQRDRARDAGRGTVALLGASRIQLGFVPEAFAEVHPDVETIQLAIPGKGPFAALRDLADDESFAGLAICSVTALTLQPFDLEAQQDFVDYYHTQWGPGAKASLLLSTALQERLVVLQPQTRGYELLNLRLMAALIPGLERWTGDRAELQLELPRVSYLKTLFNRHRVADFGLIDTEVLIETRIAYIRGQLRDNPPASEAEWRDIVRRLAGFVERIGSRGGKVAFVRFPMTGRFEALDREFFPRERYWDTLAASVGTVVIHSEEMPGVRDLRCPDESHLDTAGAIAFTKWLGRELTNRGLLQ